MADQHRRPEIRMKRCEWWWCGNACQCQQTIIELEEVIDAPHASTNLHRWESKRYHRPTLCQTIDMAVAFERAIRDLTDLYQVPIHPDSRSAARLHAMLQQDRTRCSCRRCIKRRQKKAAKRLRKRKQRRTTC